MPLNVKTPYVEIFGVPIYYYGLIIATAIFVVFVLGLWIFKQLGWTEGKKWYDIFDAEIPYLIVMIIVPLGVICARIYYIIFSPDIAMFNSFYKIINLRDGGLAIYGAVIGGALGLYIISRMKKVGFFTLADVVAICLILAQAIGRWGNYMNQEAYGIGVAHHVPPFTVDIDPINRVDPQYRYYVATFFIESILNLIGFAVLFVYFFYEIKLNDRRVTFTKRDRSKYCWGTTSALYLIWYGLVRVIVEPLRTDSLYIFGHNPIVFNRISFMLSIALIAFGVLLFIAARRKWTSQTTPTPPKKTNT